MMFIITEPLIIEVKLEEPAFYIDAHIFSNEFTYKEISYVMTHSNISGAKPPLYLSYTACLEIDIHILYNNGGGQYTNQYFFVTGKEELVQPPKELVQPPKELVQPPKELVQPPLIPEDFDWKTYLDLNPDIARVFSTKEEAVRHYLQSGIRETRRYKFRNIPDGFEWDIYLDLNPDVKSVIKDRIGALHHYERNGHKEKRAYQYSNIPVGFDWEIYLELNPDVKSVIKDRIGALHHYERNGHKEKRAYKFSNVPDDFDWEFYLALNADVKQSYKTRLDAMKHYQYYGKKEKRRYNLQHLPADFDCDTYVALNPDIPCRFLHTDSSVKLHYELYGRVASRKYKINRSNIPNDFNWKLYQELNPHLLLKSELNAIIHYNTIGFYKQLTYKYDDIDTNNKIGKDRYLQHPFLFHKYILNVDSPKNELHYNIVQRGTQSNVFVTHLHCYNLDLFGDFYDDYIDNLLEISDVIVTYSIGTITPKHENLTILQIENRGMDIGGKYNAVGYLKDIQHPYKNILFLHSKTDEHTRKLYWRPLVENLDKIKNMTSNSEYDNVGVWTPPLIYMGDYNHCLYTHHHADPTRLNPRWNPGNVWYMDDIDEFMEFQSNNKFFPEGNCFVAKRELAEALYSDLEMYNILNTMTSFDAVWIKAWYGDIQNRNVGTNIYEIFDFYMSNKSALSLHPNNIKLGHLGYRDNMIEHCYERIVFKMVEKMGYDVHIMPPIGVEEPSETHKQFNRLLNRYFKTKQLE